MEASEIADRLNEIEAMLNSAFLNARDREHEVLCYQLYSISIIAKRAADAVKIMAERKS